MTFFRQAWFLALLITLQGCGSGGYVTDNPDEFCKERLLSAHQEARIFLSASPRNTLGPIQSNAESIAYVNNVYSMGAPHIFIVDLDMAPPGFANTGKLVVELPSDKVGRAKVIEWAAGIAHEQGFDAYSDVGQKYVFVALD